MRLAHVPFLRPSQGSQPLRAALASILLAPLLLLALLRLLSAHALNVQSALPACARVHNSEFTRSVPLAFFRTYIARLPQPGRLNKLLFL